MLTPRTKLVSLLFSILLCWQVVAAEPVAVNPSHPDRYVVVKCDTLWDISARFLREPWRWPDVWHVNPQIANPHLIYPGDVIVMTYVNGQPRLGLERGSLVKLSPRVRSSELDGAIPSIPVDAIQQFLTRPFVMDAGELESAPYVVHFANEHILGSNNIKAYIRSIDNEDNLKWNIVRPGGPYKDADTDEILGYEALYIAGAELLSTGDPASVMITDTELESTIGDRLIPVSQDVPITTFFPKAPDREIKGSIIDVLNGVSQIGQFNVVVIDRGESDGLAVGDVLAIDHKGRTVRDKIAKDPRETVKLPDEAAGTLMVFRIFPRVSFGLVMDATQAIHVLDRVHNP